MNKSIGKTITKAAAITLGALLLLAGLINPLTHYAGLENPAICDTVTFNERSDGLYDINISYHYFVSGREYQGSLKTTGEYDETISLSTHYVRYLPFLPSLGILDSFYKLPLESILSASFGFVFLVLGLFIKTARKESKTKAKETPIKKAFVCPACLKEVDSDSIFCNYCGRKILF